MSCLARQLVRPLRPCFHQSVFQLFAGHTHTSQSAVAAAAVFSEQPAAPPNASRLHTSAVAERARQATRLRKRKVVLENIKKKAERLRKNPPPMPKKVKLMMKLKGLGDEPIDWRSADTNPFPTDDVWDEQWTTWRRLTVAQAVNCLREHYHPTMLNNPNGIVMARVEFDMTSKKDRYVDASTKMVPLYHPFERGVTQKAILMFAKNDEALTEAREAGAEKAGGVDLIEDIAKGKIDVIDYDYFLAHEDIALELKPLLGILREKFPKKILGTVGTDIKKMVKTFQNGQLVEIKKPKPTLGYKEDPSFGYCETMIGRLDMPDEHIDVNFSLLLDVLSESAPKKSAGFITRAQLFVDDKLKCKFTVCHDRISDAKFKKHSAN